MTDQRPRRKKGWMNLKVTEVIDETHDTKTFVMVDNEDGGIGFDYIPGQYLTFRFDDVADRPVARSYTMSSSPCQPDMCAFTVKRVEKGLISNWLCDEVKVGSVLRARGPIGKFCYDPKTDLEHLFMVAGGSGVTPFVSVLREYAKNPASGPKKMTLLVSYRSDQDLICWDTLEEVNHRENIKVITTLSRQDLTAKGFWYGRIDEGMLAEAIAGQYQGVTFMTCGPIPMMNALAAHCAKNGVPPEQVKTESFES